MSPQLPSFLRRRLRLSEARRALLAGQPEQALAQVTDPCLALSEEADRLRIRVLEVLCREAAQRQREDEPHESRRLLSIVAAHDPERAATWRRRLASEQASQASAKLPERAPAAQSGIITALEGLLSDMRDERTRSGMRRNQGATESADTRIRDAASSVVHGHPQRKQQLFQLAVDDLGEFVVVCSPEVTLGHARAGQADLPFLADLAPLAARLQRTMSFHSGPGWRIEPEARQDVAINGELVDEGGASLSSGDEVQLATNLAFRYLSPVAGSGTAILELLHGAECRGALHVVLLAPGEDDPLRLSASRGRHLRVPRLPEEVALWLDGAELVVESTSKLRVTGHEVGVQPPSPAGPGGLRFDCPPARRVDVTLGEASASRPPLQLSIWPIDRPGDGA